QHGNDQPDQQKVAAEQLCRRWLLDFDRDPHVLVTKPCAMDLSDRCRGYRIRLPSIEQEIERRAKLFLDDLPRDLGREAEGLSLQLGQLAADLQGEDIDAKREDLSRFDPEAAQPLQDGSNAPGVLLTIEAANEEQAHKDDRQVGKVREHVQ